MSMEATTFRISPDSKSQLEFLARQKGTTFTELARMAVDEFLESRMPKPGLIIPIVSGPSLDELKEGLFQECKDRMATEFQVDAPQLGVCGAYPVYVHELTRVAKGTVKWNFMGYVDNGDIEPVQVRGEYDCVSGKGQVKL